MSNLIHRQLDNILTCYEQAATLPRNSPGAWHNALIKAVRDAGYDVRNYREAKEKASEVINAYTRPTR
jgi:hypothetical protein